MVTVIVSKATEALTWLNTYHPYLLVFLVAEGALKVFNVFDSLSSVWIQTVFHRGSISSYKPQGDDAKSKHNWAVVTGCTAGIGEEYALQLAAAGFNIALVSRSESKLQDVAAKIAQRSPEIETKYFVLDAAAASSPEYTKFGAFIAALGDVSVLINNVGVSHEMPVPFAEVSESEMHNIIQVNCVSTLEITRAVLPSISKYTAANEKNQGLILTMGSFAGLTPSPLLSVYSGSKAFLQGWSSALGAELSSSRIDVQLVISYLVTSQMSKIRRTSLLVTDPKNFVASALNQTKVRGGAQERAFTSTPYWSHAFMHWGIENTLGVFSKTVSFINRDMHEKIRARALKKKAKQN